MRLAILMTWTVLLGILAASIAFAINGLGAMPAAGYAALAIGAVLTVVVGAGLMALVFYSSRHGYDDPPRLER